MGHVGPMASEYVPDGIPFLRSQDIAPFRIRREDLREVSPEFHGQLQKSALSPGDVVIVRTGRPGTAAVIPDDLPVANCADLVIVRPGPELDARFLAYYINTAAQHYVAAHLVGAVQQHFNVASAKALDLVIPSITEQRRIVQVLGALDDKIDSNHRLAALLEETAATLFRARFVDFVGMEEFEESEIARIPQGWREGHLGELATVTKHPIQPSQTPELCFEHFGIPSFDADHRPEIVRGADLLSGKTRLPDDDCVLLSKLNPATKRVWWPHPDGRHTAVCSPEFMVLVRRGRVPTTYLYATVTQDGRFYAELLSHVSGTTGSRQRVKPDAVLGCRVLIPSAPALEEWNSVAHPLYESAAAASAEGLTLGAIRDALLPKLISGEIRVADTADLTEMFQPAADELAAAS